MAVRKNLKLLKYEDIICHFKTRDIEIPLTLPLPNLVVPHLLPRGGVAGPPAVSKTVAPMNLTFFRVLDKSFNVLEMLKLFTYCLLGCHSNPSKERCFIGKMAIFQPKIPIFQIATKFTIIKIALRNFFLANNPIIAYLKNVILCGWESQILGRDRRNSRVKNGKNCHFSKEIRGNCSNFALEG